MSKASLRVISGATDTEMLTITNWAHELGIPVTPATHRGEAVTTKTVLKCDAVAPRPNEVLVFVECKPLKGLPSGAVYINHHEEGDPGFGLPPERFWEASSLGQFDKCLRQYGYEKRLHPVGTPPEHQLLIAAADHCLAAAYAGLCVPITKSQLRTHRVKLRALMLSRDIPHNRTKRKNIARYAGVSVAHLDYQGVIGWERAVQRCIEGAITAIQRAPYADLSSSVRVRDLRNMPTIPVLPEAAAILGEAVLYMWHESNPTSVVAGKIGIMGAGTGTQSGEMPIRAFLNEYSLQNCLVETYGCPRRGFAGGLLLRPDVRAAR